MKTRQRQSFETVGDSGHGMFSLMELGSVSGCETGMRTLSSDSVCLHLARCGRAAHQPAPDPNRADPA